MKIKEIIHNVKHPEVVDHEGEKYWPTGKNGVSATGIKGAEYASHDLEGKPSGKKVWHFANGKIQKKE